MAAAKIIDAQVIANGASVTKTLSVNGFEWVAVELTNDQTCDLSVTASTVDATSRVPTLTNDNAYSYTLTNLSATSNGRTYIRPLRRLMSTLAVTVTNKSGGADATVNVWVALS